MSTEDIIREQMRHQASEAIKSASELPQVQWLAGLMVEVYHETHNKLDPSEFLERLSHKLSESQGQDI